jgi:hypothetical protein
MACASGRGYGTKVPAGEARDAGGVEKCEDGF